MLKHQLLLPEGILILEPDSPLEAADFEGLVREIDPYIAEHGKLSGLMIHAKAFPGWANLEAFLAHMQFIKSHHQKIVRLAMVTDSKLLGELPKSPPILCMCRSNTFRNRSTRTRCAGLRRELRSVPNPHWKYE